MNAQKELLDDQEIRIASIIEAEQALHGKYAAVDAMLAETMVIMNETQHTTPQIDMVDAVMSLEQRVEAIATDVKALVTNERPSTQTPFGNGRDNTANARTISYAPQGVGGSIGKPNVRTPTNTTQTVGG